MTRDEFIKSWGLGARTALAADLDALVAAAVEAERERIDAIIAKEQSWHEELHNSEHFAERHRGGSEALRAVRRAIMDRAGAKPAGGE